MSSIHPRELECDDCRYEDICNKKECILCTENTVNWKTEQGRKKQVETSGS